ncbi:MAG: immunoglobulin domain-containing protein [Verrucomicrobia bacterium]|nr:immunoglobulin domain-containing protein [Verrucomicrobiota bacterium]
MKTVLCTLLRLTRSRWLHAALCLGGAWAPLEASAADNPYAGTYIGTLHDVTTSSDAPLYGLADTEFTIEADGTFAITAQFTGTVASDGTMTFTQPGLGLKTGHIDANGTIVATEDYPRLNSSHPAHTVRLDATRQGDLLPAWKKVDLTNLAPPATNLFSISTVAQGNGAVVAVVCAYGSSADWVALRTTDGVTWTRNPIALGLPADPRTYSAGVKFAGGKFWFGVYGDNLGGPTTRIYSSADGITWTGVDTGLTARTIVDFASAYGRTWALLGRDGGSSVQVLSSTDGATWTLGTVATDISGNVRNFTTGGGRLAISVNSTTSKTDSAPNYVTTDGTTWTLAPFTPAIRFNGSAAAYGPAGFVSAANPTSNDPTTIRATGTVFHSDDFITWTHLDPGPDITADGINHYQPFIYMSYTGGKYYAISQVSALALYRSDDAGTWRKVVRPLPGTTGMYVSDAPIVIGSRVIVAAQKELYAADLPTGDGYPVGRPPSLLTAPTGSSVSAGGSFGFSASFTGHGLAVSYQWQHDGVDIPGATMSSYFVSSAKVSDSGDYVIIADNGVGQARSKAVKVNVAGGTAPVITVQPVSAGFTAGSSVTLAVTASGTGLTYQWSKGGTPINGATSRTYTIANATAGDAGEYTVQVTNTTASVTSAIAVLTFTDAPAPVKPSIVAAPQNRQVTAGADVSFTVVAGGTAPFTYQWKKNGADLPGATDATLSLTAVAVGGTGEYSVVVTNSAGSITSAIATLVVAPSSFSGFYFGTFAPDAGSWALTVKPDNTATYLAYLAQRHSVIVISLSIGQTGDFTVTGTEIRPLAATGARALAVALQPEGGALRAATAAAGFTLTGRIGPDGSAGGSLTGLGVTFAGALDVPAGPPSPAAGFYTATALAAATGTTYAMVGPSGQALVVTSSSTLADGATGIVGANGQLSVTTADNTLIQLAINPQAQGISATLTPAGATAPVNFAGLPDTARPLARLINFSVRASAGTGDQTPILGFVVNGTGGKALLLRGVGPTLGTQGVGAPLADPSLRLLDARGAELAVNNDWGGGNALSQQFSAVGAFALPANSKDAALSSTLTAGVYSLHVLAGGPGSGVVLGETYDADDNTSATNIANISARAQVGTGEGVLVAGFVVAGNSPKTILIRGLGPTLAGNGVAGVLSDPRLNLYAGGSLIASNDNWGGTTALKDAFAAVGASSLVADNSKDAALLVTLMPGVYSAQVSGVGGATGVGLIEIYLVP